MRKKKLFNCEVIFHLEESFMSSLLLLIQLQRKQNYGFFCCWSSGGMQQDHISPVTTYGPIWKQKKNEQNPGLGLAWLSRCQNIQNRYYRMHAIIPGAEAKQAVCPTTWNSSFQPCHWRPPLGGRLSRYRLQQTPWGGGKAPQFTL